MQSKDKSESILCRWTSFI